ncbi:MAG TPA: NAD(P)/FAD-dependent oxidoreductase [Vicinamibacteria bacterium]|nr:NAD(P)/FAD-dependent oxidoreductase [Vicinamibacteria bacterium]
MKAAVVGGGPAGALLSFHLARDGAAVTLYDHSHPREKPCGGAFTPRALDLLPEAPADDPLPVRRVHGCRFDSGAGEAVDVALARAVGIGSRRLVDAWLLRRATGAGVRHVAERVRSVRPGLVLTAGGREERHDLVLGADGASSLVRRTFLGPLPAERLTMAAGWFARGESEMVVRFTPGLAGYLWLFPRPDHVGVGICAPLASVPTREMLARLASEVARAFPALSDEEAERYAHIIPSPTTEAASILETAGDDWALVGDAAALADPITGEGIYFALRSAALLADTLRGGASPRAYAQRAYDEFGRDLVKAAALRARFFAPGFASRMVRYAQRSAAVRGVLGDLVLGTQGYVGLKRRLLGSLPRFLWQMAR